MEKSFVRQILRELLTISRCINYIRNVDFKKYDLNRGQYAFLTRIIENPGISQEEISLKLKIDRTTTAKAIKKIEKKGYVIRTKSEKDNRVWCIYPTKKLKKIYPDIKESIIALAKVGVQDFTDEEIISLHKLLKKFSVNIDTEWNKYRS